MTALPLTWVQLAHNTVLASIDQHASLPEASGHRLRPSAAYHEDVRLYVDSLPTGIAPQQADRTALFVRYTCWFYGVLHSRGLMAGCLDHALAALADLARAELDLAQHPDLLPALSAARQALTVPLLPPTYTTLYHPALPSAADCQQGLLAGQTAAVGRLLARAMREGHSLAEVEVGLLQPSLYGIGQLWQDNRITVAQEHLASAVAQNVMSRAYLHADFAPANGRKAVLACVADNHHALGLTMVADALETAGWAVVNLGANVPQAALLEMLETEQPDLLALSLSMPGQEKAARAALQAIRGEWGGHRPALWVGGLTTLGFPQLARALGADEWSADAVDMLAKLA